MRQVWLAGAALIGCALISCCHSPVEAGVTGENVIVVVNADSVDSMTVANHYGSLRAIPDCNFIFLDDVPTEIECEIDEFKNQILLPILKTLEKRKLGTQAKVIAYSTDFPTSVQGLRFVSMIKDPTIKKIQGKEGSLTGLTFLYPFVLAEDPGFLSLQSNLYARGRFERHFVNPFPSKDSNGWSEAEQLDRDEDFANAGDRWMEFLNQHPMQGPAAIKAAQSYARAGQDTKAFAALARGIALGWRSKRFIEEDEALSGLIVRRGGASAQRRLGFDKLDDLPTVTQHPVGFASELNWTHNGWPSKDPKKGMRYLPSCMLGVVHPRGSTVDQIIEVLTRSAGSDHSFPDAPFYFTNTSDIRSKTRLPRAAEALMLLKSLGKDGQLIPTAAPAEDVELAGLMLGTPLLRPSQHVWSLVPGSISENLTSTSCHFRSSQQTKATELLHRGASLTCGPVAEPYAIAQKFPDPMLYSHYARGATGIESMYLSIQSPYQTLVIGDPLASAFVKPPSKDLTIGSTEKATGTSAVITLRSNLVEAAEVPASAIEIYLEGRLVQRVPLKNPEIRRQVGNRIEINGSESLNGFIEVRSTLVGPAPLQSRKFKRTQVDFGGRGKPIKVVQDGLAVTVSCDGASKMEIKSRQRTLASSASSTCTIVLDKAKVGTGPVRIKALATIDGKRVGGEPFTVKVPD